MRRAFLEHFARLTVGFGSMIMACGTDAVRADPRPAEDAGTNDSGARDDAVGGDAGDEVDRCNPQKGAESTSVAGCRFFLTAFALPSSRLVLSSGCHAIVVTNPSSSRARLRLRFRRGDETRIEDATPYAARVAFDGPSATYSPLDEDGLPPHATAIVSALFVPYEGTTAFGELSQCPTKPFLRSFEPIALDEFVTRTIELESDVPVLATQFIQYRPAGLDPRAWLSLPFTLFPTHLWATDTVETGTYKPGLPPWIRAKEGDVNTMPARTLVLAAFDGTHVSLPTPSGSTRAITLERGQLFTHVTGDELAGKPIHADKPVAAISYAPTAVIDWNVKGLPDGRPSSITMSMALPKSQWGSEYVAARYANRWPELAEAPAWRILGGADATRLSYDPYRPEGAPESIGKGELAVFFADAPFSVRSQDEAHPFYFSESMTDPVYQLDRYDRFSGDGRGNSFTVHQIPVSRWKKQAPFFVTVDLPDQTLVVVRPRGGAEVRLDCAGPLTGWEPVGERFEYTRVPLIGHLFEPVAYPAGTCQPGAHWIESDGPFSGTLWAWGHEETASMMGRRSGGAQALPLFGVDPAPATSEPK